MPNRIIRRERAPPITALGGTSASQAVSYRRRAEARSLRRALAAIPILRFAFAARKIHIPSYAHTQCLRVPIAFLGLRIALFSDRAAFQALARAPALQRRFSLYYSGYAGRHVFQHDDTSCRASRHDIDCFMGAQPDMGWSLDAISRHACAFRLLFNGLFTGQVPGRYAGEWAMHYIRPAAANTLPGAIANS